MILIKPSIEFLWMTPNPLQAIEIAGRTCYKSEDKITSTSAIQFAYMLLKRGHYAMIEHASLSYRVVCDRGVTHEIVRHRLFSYAQESTRYCNYKSGVTFIIPPWITVMSKMIGAEVDVYQDKLCFSAKGHAGGISYGVACILWFEMLQKAESTYQRLLIEGWSPQQARSVLPNALKTEIIITGNLREWRHFFSLRVAPNAYPRMREVAYLLLNDARKRISIVFEGFKRGSDKFC